MTDLRALIRDSEGGRMPENVGIASVDRDGGFRMGGAVPFLGLLGNAGPLIPRDSRTDSSDCRRVLSAERAASK